jgi:ABC-type Zn2+ transport system substrate-binding protein/surface adhesin
LGDVAALMESNSMDQIFAAAAATSSTTARPSESKQDDNDDDSNQQRQDQEQQQKQHDGEQEEEEEDEEEQRARAVEPYGIRERVDSRASVVSLSGIQSVLKSVLGRASFISAPEPATDQQ